MVEHDINKINRLDEKLRNVMWQNVSLTYIFTFSYYDYNVYIYL